MAIVPVYQPGQVSERPALQQRFTVRASGEDMGAATARGLGAVAQGVGQVADAMFQVRDMEDTARAKEADNAFAAWVRERQYGQNGYLTLEGKAAVDGRAAFEADLEAKRREFGNGLSPTAGTKYNAASGARVNSALDSSIVHSANQRKTWFKEASTARIDTFAEDALAGYKNPAVIGKNIALGQAELRSMGELQGWDADTLKNREAEYISGVHKNVALRMAQDDPLAADAYRKANNDALTGPHQYELEAALGGAVKEAEAVRLTEEILMGGRASGGADPASLGMSGPTRARQVLTERAVGGATRPDAVDNLDAAFATNLAAMMEDAPPGIREGLGLMSGYRSEERQAELWAEALQKYGSEAEARKWVAPPGNSYHNSGQAVDLSWNGKSLKDAPKEVIDWVHANAGKYGMYFPMAHEPWHIEPSGTRSGTVAPRNGSVASRTMMPGYDQIEASLEGITDPQVRDLVRKRLNAQIEAQNKAQSAAETAAKAELWRAVEAGYTPDQVPQDLRVAAGMAAVSSAWGYIEATAARGKPKDDDVLVYDMRRYAAENPDQFSQIDLNDYRTRLSPETFKELTGLQTSALNDGRKASQEGLALTSAFSQATGALEAVGITATGKDGAKREEAARRVAQFNNVLAAQMAEFKAANDGKNPNQMEIQSMINRLLLPVVIEEPGRLWGTRTTEVPMFEVGRLGNVGGSRTAEIGVDYAKIPPADRIEIEVALEAQYGRKPSETEVEAAYSAYLTNSVNPPAPPSNPLAIDPISQSNLPSMEETRTNSMIDRLRKTLDQTGN
jgi:hypothetical protein